MVFSSEGLPQNSPRWGSGVDFSQRASKREQSRWSLSEWLAMKDRNRMMDMWLSLNAPSPFEFMLGGSYDSLDSGPTGYSGYLSAYAQFIGLSAEYRNTNDEGFNDLAGMLNVRLLGNSIQNTAFTIHYGQKTRDFKATGEKLTQQFGQVSLQVYLTKYFGLDGIYRHYLPTNTPSLGEVQGTYQEAGIFIDFKAVRVFGAWFQDTQKNKTPSAIDETINERKGVHSGIKIFF